MRVYPRPTHYFTRQEWGLIVFHLEVGGRKQLAARIANRVVISSSETPGIRMDDDDDYAAVETALKRAGIKQENPDAP